MLLRHICLFLCLSTVIALSKRSRSSHSRGISTTRARFTKRVSKVGSIERTALFRSTVLGAAAGYVTFNAGRHVINSASKPMMFEDRAFYWDSDYFTPTEVLPTQCSHKIDPVDPQLGRLSFDDDTRPSEIVYGCRENQICCGFDCCDENTFFTSLFSLLVMILVFSVLAIFVIEAFRWGINCMYTCRTGSRGHFEPLSI